LKKIKIPDLDLIENNDQNILVNAYDNRDIECINSIVNNYCKKLSEQIIVPGDSRKFARENKTLSLFS
jgi:hypothetical protein